jgi:hypothetical protein
MTLSLVCGALLGYSAEPQRGMLMLNAVHTPSMVSRHVLELCTSPTTLISELAKEPNQPISGVAKRLFKHHGARFKQNINLPSVEDETNELDIVARCGSFPRRPSDLFLQALSCHFLHDLL